MSSGPELRLNSEDRANLVAYIDGELSEEEARALSTKLMHSATGRHEVELLRQTWQILEHLERPRATDDFPDRTLTQIQALESELGRWKWFAEHRLLFLKAGLSIAVAFLGIVLGFAITRWLVPDPGARLIQDLSIAEHLDDYREVGTFEFLEELAKSQEFGQPGP